MSQKSPIACTLTDSEFQKHRSGLLARMRESIKQVEPHEQGYALRFESDETTLEQLTKLIQFERKCCPFLEFELKVLPENGPVWLHLSGPDGTKEFIKSLFVIE